MSEREQRVADAETYHCVCKCGRKYDLPLSWSNTTCNGCRRTLPGQFEEWADGDLEAIAQLWNGPDGDLIRKLYHAFDRERREATATVAELRSVSRALETVTAERDALIAKYETRRFPIMDGADIPWLVVAPHEKQARENHGQSLERLAERGGLSVQEALHVIEGECWSLGPTDLNQLSQVDSAARLDAHVRRSLAAGAVAPAGRTTETTEWPPCHNLNNVGMLHPSAKPPCNGKRCVKCDRKLAAPRPSSVDEYADRLRAARLAAPSTEIKER